MRSDKIRTNDLPKLLKSFNNKVEHELKFLNNFSIDKFDDEISNTWSTVLFRNEKRAVKIHYSVLDQMIYTKIIRIIKGMISKETEPTNFISLETLITYHSPTCPVFEKLFVKDGKFEEPIIFISESLKKYASGILLGSEWISEREAMEKIQKR